ncbi:hypothetical protein ANO14919_136570 [Xylariales sp. No.14919]|nr:hypothetical protein ANO14919_136570 [Xylariales sp. No.14919]
MVDGISLNGGVIDGRHVNQDSGPCRLGFADDSAAKNQLLRAQRCDFLGGSVSLRTSFVFVSVLLLEIFQHGRGHTILELHPVTSTVFPLNAAFGPAGGL